MIVSNGWAEALDRLEEALDADTDGALVAAIRLDEEWGPVPPALAVRATSVLRRVQALEDRVNVRLAALDSEISQQHRPHHRRNGRTLPPPPGQLDCSA